MDSHCVGGLIRDVENGKIASRLDIYTVKSERFAHQIAFVDVETTGSSPDRGRITEVGIVTVDWPDPHPGPPRVERWHSLVNPGVAIPPEIRFLTGIDNQMVSQAPPFSALADQIEARLADAVFIAHHARFDYGFLKSEMARIGRRFHCRTLCTVRLSRALDPQRSPHTLDALIHRWRLPCPERHRALGDAQVLWQLLQAFEREYGINRLNEVARGLISRPNLPAHLNVRTLDEVPAAPGIYFFHGLNELPLYIGKSRNIRQRIASHFCVDYQSARGVRLASETRAISWTETAGEFSALLAESQAIGQRQPAHNRALRRQAGTCFVSFAPGSPQPVFTAAGPMPGGIAGGLLGPFASRAAARQQLIALGRQHRWCLRTMGLEKGHNDAPCFARQLGRCEGACVGAQTSAELARRIERDIAVLRLPRWPEQGQLLLLEQDPTRGRSAWHLFFRWCWLASGEDPAQLTDWLAANPPSADGAHGQCRIELSVLNLLVRTIGRAPILVTDPLPGLPVFDDDAHWTTHNQRASHLSWCWLACQPGRQ